MKKTVVCALALFISAGSAYAQQQWNDLLPVLSSSPGWQAPPFNTAGAPASAIYISALGTNCTAGPSSIAVYATQCSAPTFFQSSIINIDQFARESDVVALQQSLQAASSRANQGIAMSLAMAGVGDLQSDEHIAFSGNWGTFQGQNGGAIGVAYRLSDHVSVNGGFAGSFTGNYYGGRAGIRIGW